MTTVAVVPVQSLSNAKSRLAGRFSPDERCELVLDLLQHVVDELLNSSLIDAVFVVSPDERVLRAAMALRARPLRQHGHGLNEALRLGQAAAQELNTDRIMIVLADLPLLTTEQIDELLRLSDLAPVTLAPDRHGLGTNILVLRPPDALEPAFGIDSLAIHRAAARARGLAIREYQSPETSYDLDTTDDLEALATLGRPIRSVIARHGSERLYREKSA
ncbi:MAG: 2-phospho-L-lactate guanylyltransferase [Thermomicrobiales bacterium]|nr:2-phospho-L-lactate guanylyltransferase [Thermomicrobiales bacterium]